MVILEKILTHQILTCGQKCVPLKTSLDTYRIILFRSHEPATCIYGNILKRKSFATVLHPFFLQCGPCEDILMIISYVPAQ